jgi:hypothetical protein
MSAVELAGGVAPLLYGLRGREVEDQREVNRRPLMVPISARRRNGGEGTWGAEEVEVWRHRFTRRRELRPAGGGGLALP